MATNAPTNYTLPRFMLFPCLVSSTGMLHTQGCPALRPYRSTAYVVTAAAAASMTVRCERCTPRPFGTWVPQTVRATKAEVAAAKLAEVTARNEAAKAKRDAAQADWTPEADAAVAAFYANEGQDTWDAMQALCPTNPDAGTYSARARLLGLTRS